MRRMKGRLLAGVVSGALVAWAIGCGGSLPRPPTSPHTPEEYSLIPFPPPAIRADLVPAEARPGAYWIDGEWNWNGIRWAWRSGAYVIPPAGATFARWEIQRDGASLRHAPSVFHLAGGGSIAPAELRENRPNRPKDIECVPLSSASPSASDLVLTPPVPSGPRPPAGAFLTSSSASSAALTPLPAGHAAPAAACVLVEP